MDLDDAKKLLATAEGRTLAAGLELGGWQKKQRELEEQLRGERDRLGVAEAAEVEARINGSRAVDPDITQRIAREVRATEAALATVAQRIDAAKVAQSKAREAEANLRRHVKGIDQADRLREAAITIEIAFDSLRIGGDDLVTYAMLTLASRGKRPGEIGEAFGREADSRASNAVQQITGRRRRRFEPLLSNTLLYSLRPFKFATQDERHHKPSQWLGYVPAVVARRAAEFGAAKILPAVAWYASIGDEAVSVAYAPGGTLEPGRAALMPADTARAAGLEFKRDANAEEIITFAQTFPAWLSGVAGTSRIGGGDLSPAIDLGEVTADEEAGLAEPNESTEIHESASVSAELPLALEPQRQRKTPRATEGEARA